MTHGSFSQVSELHNCEWRFWLKYGAGWEPGERAGPPDLGSAVHAGIAAQLKDEDPLAAINAWTELERARLERFDEFAPEMVADGFDVLADVEMSAPALVERWLEWWTELGWRPVTHRGVLLVEQPIEIEHRGHTFRFVPDLVADDRQGGIWVTDWKVRSQFTSLEGEQCNLQKGLYQWALGRIGLATTGSALVQIYHQLPAVPEVNKGNGKVSRSTIRTDWSTYKGVIESIGQDPADYEDVRQKIEGKGWEWFLLHKVWRGEPEQEAIAEHILWPSLDRGSDILNGRALPLRALSPFRCERCWARLPCNETMRGTALEELTLGLQRRDPNGRGGTAQPILSESLEDMADHGGSGLGQD